MFLFLIASCFSGDAPVKHLDWSNSTSVDVYSLDEKGINDLFLNVLLLETKQVNSFLGKARYSDVVKSHFISHQMNISKDKLNRTAQQNSYIIMGSRKNAGRMILNISTAIAKTTFQAFFVHNAHHHLYKYSRLLNQDEVNKIAETLREIVFDKQKQYLNE